MINYTCKRRKYEMINQLHLAMIELYKGDAKRIQHFCKVHSYAKLIAETENVDKNCQFIIEAAAFLQLPDLLFLVIFHCNFHIFLHRYESQYHVSKLLLL